MNPSPPQARQDRSVEEAMEQQKAILEAEEYRLKAEDHAAVAKYQVLTQTIVYHQNDSVHYCLSLHSSSLIQSSNQSNNPSINQSMNQSLKYHLISTHHPTYISQFIIPHYHP